MNRPRKRRDHDFFEEIQAHIAAETDELIREGVDPDAARAEAVRRFGNPLAASERFYEARRVLWWDHLHQDVRYAFRTMRRKPGWTAVILIMLAVAIGANTAMFSAVDSILLRPLPYRDAANLVVLWAQVRQFPDQKFFLSYRDFKEFRRSAKSFKDVAAVTWANAGQTLLWKDKPLRVLSIPSTDNLFSLLGIDALHGRTFVPADSKLGCSVVLAHRFWQNRLNGERDIVNTALTLDGTSCTVVGIAPKDFEFFPKETELWTLIPSDSPFDTNPSASVAVFGRLRNGVSKAEAQNEVAALHASVAQSSPAVSWLRDSSVSVYDLQGEFTFLSGANLRIALLVLFGAVTIVLLIACVNIASLLLSSGVERQRELAVRVAVGCSRGRIIRQLVTESLVLAGVGGALGVGLALAGIKYLRAVNPINLPPGGSIEINAKVLLFTAGLSVLTGLVFGILPSLHVSRMDLQKSLKKGKSRVGLGSRGGMRSAFVIAEVTLSMLLLVGAALLIESFHRLTATPLSFDPSHLWTASMTLPADAYRDVPERAKFYDAVLTNIAALPGVRGAALSSNRVLGGQSVDVVTIFGRTAPSTELGDVGVEQVSSDFMPVMGVPVLRGRNFTAGDHDRTEQVAIVNARFVSEYFPNEDPIGKQIKIGLNGESPWRRIVGVSGNVERGDFMIEMGYQYVPVVYLPIGQRSTPTMSLIVRIQHSPSDFAESLQRTVASLDSRVPLSDVRTVDSLISTNFSQPRFRTILLSAFAGLALLLAAVGLYGLVTQTVVQMTREIGIRLALGAARRDIARMMLGRGLLLASLGIAGGLLTSLYLTRFLRTMLYNVKSTDLPILAATAAVLMSVTVVAISVPVRRATRVDPIRVLKEE